MRCASCDNDNAPDSRFCVGCGASLSRACPSCSHVNAAAARFCSQCGNGLTALAATASPPPGAPASSEGELKQITVLFADVAGYSALSDAQIPPFLDAPA